MMKTLIGITLCSILALSATTIADSTQKPADNAALRYWMAFAQMNDSQISHVDAMRMDAMINSGSAWDEKQFGPILEQNKAAIETMIRGSNLPYCDWGLESELGPATPIDYVPKARALARLNNMYAMRLASVGDYHGAARSNHRRHKIRPTSCGEWILPERADRQVRTAAGIDTSRTHRRK